MTQTRRRTRLSVLPSYRSSNTDSTAYRAGLAAVKDGVSHVRGEALHGLSVCVGDLRSVSSMYSLTPVGRSRVLQEVLFASPVHEWPRLRTQDLRAGSGLVSRFSSPR